MWQVWEGGFIKIKTCFIIIYPRFYIPCGKIKPKGGGWALGTQTSQTVNTTTQTYYYKQIYYYV